jgi:hypothetical protein
MAASWSAGGSGRAGSLGAAALAALGVALAVLAVVAGADTAAVILGVLAAALTVRIARDMAAPTGRLSSSIAEVALHSAPDVEAAAGGAAEGPAAETARAA